MFIRLPCFFEGYFLACNNPSVKTSFCHRLGCRLGRCFCFAEVSTGHPHPYTGEAFRLPSFAIANRGELSTKLTEGYFLMSSV